MSETKDYAHVEIHISHPDDTKMTLEEMSKIHLEITDFLINKGYRIFGDLGLKDDDELSEELNYGDDIIEAAAFIHAAIPEEGPDEINYDARVGFEAGARFVRAKVDARYRK